MKFPYRPRSLFSKLMVSHLVVVALSLIIIGFFLTYLIENYFLNTREWELTAQTRNVVNLIEEDLNQRDLQELEKTVVTLAFSHKMRIKVLDHQGDQLFLADHVDTQRENESEQREGVGLEDREINHIFEGNMLTKKVYGPDFKRFLAAAPVFSEEEEQGEGDNLNNNGEQVIGAVILSAPLSGIEETIAQVSLLFLYSGGIGVVIAGILAFSLSKTLTRPLLKLNRAALNMASGDFRCKIDEEPDNEIGGLIKSFNYSVEQVEQTLEEQKRLEKLRRNLVANVSHELKAPLSSIRGFSELMLDGLISEEEKEKYLGVILDNSVHLSRIVDDLLKLSHLESGQMSLKVEDISPRKMVERSFESMKVRGDEKGVSLHLEVPDDLPTVRGDRYRLHEVLINLLDNAIEFTPAGGDVWIRAYTKGSWMVLEVADTGRGIPQEDLPNIFERFYKIDKSRNRSSKGSGLGLAIARQLVELHQGEIEAESRVDQGSREDQGRREGRDGRDGSHGSDGQGSTFRVWLPRT